MKAIKLLFRYLKKHWLLFVITIVMLFTLNYIRSSYPGIPVIENPSGYFNDATENTVKVFQKVFNLPQTGIVDYATWYKISYIFVAVSKMTNSIYQ